MAAPQIPDGALLAELQVAVPEDAPAVVPDQLAAQAPEIQANEVNKGFVCL